MPVPNLQYHSGRLARLSHAGIHTLPRGSARCINKTLNHGGRDWKFGFRATMFTLIATPARNCRSGLGSSPLPRRIAVLAWDRRQSRTELPFWPGIGGSLARNCRSGLGSLPLPHGMAALASGRCSEAPRKATPEAHPDARTGSRGIPCHLALGSERGAPGSGKFRRFLNPKGVRAGWVVGSDAR